MSEGRRDVTALLINFQKGTPEALDELIPFVYAELRSLASSYLRSERDGHTLQPTALVHEAFLKLVNQRTATWENRAHFFSVDDQPSQTAVSYYVTAVAEGVETVYYQYMTYLPVGNTVC